MLALLLEHLAHHGTTLLEEITIEQTMHHAVGITTNGRSEVGIEVESQAIVSDVLGGIDGLGLRADGKRGEHVLLRAVVDFLHQLVDALADLLVLRMIDDIRLLATEDALHIVAKASSKGCQAFELLLRRLVVDTIDERLGLLLHLAIDALRTHVLADGLGYRAVGQKHEFLDELVGILRHLEIHIGGLALLVEHELHLLAFESDGSLGKTTGTQLLGQAVELEHLGGKVALSGFDDFLCLLVVEATIGTCHRADNLVT